MLMGCFNLTVENKNLEVFMSTFDREYLIKKPTFSKNLRQVSHIALTNPNVLEVVISDHHSVIVTALKSQLIKGNAKMKFLQLEMLKADLDQNLKCTTSFEYSDFQSSFTRVLHNHAPIKKKSYALTTALL